jgi:hypothetical protein
VVSLLNCFNISMKPPALIRLDRIIQKVIIFIIDTTQVQTTEINIKRAH